MGKVSQLNSNKENSKKSESFHTHQLLKKYIQTQQQAMFFRPFKKSRYW